MPNVKLLFALCGTILCMSTAIARQPTTFVGPTIQGTYAGWFSPTAAYSVLGEAGVGNIRINLTAGAKIDMNQRIKLSVEYLLQDIGYHFLAGTDKEWMQQYAAGLDYQYFLDCAHTHAFDLNLYASHAPSKRLGYKEVVLFDAAGENPLLYNDNRRIAGSNAWGVLTGLIFTLWEGGDMGIDAAYDDVRYTKGNAPMRNARGLGVSMFLQQAIGEHLRFGFKAERRRPFNNFAANVNWDNYLYAGRWGFGLFGDYVQGRYTLPNTWNAGVTVNYFADCTPLPLPHKLDFKNEAEYCFWDNNRPYAAVYSPTSPPQALPYMPPEIGRKLPIRHVSYGSVTRTRKLS